MSTHDDHTIVARDIARQFVLDGAIVRVTRYGTGHINRTYLIETDNGTRGILQRINPQVFHDGERVMENIARVCAHLDAQYRARGIDPSRRVLQLLPTRAGARWLTAADGAVWRMYLAIADALAHTEAPTPALALKAASAFGEFFMLLADLPAPPLHVTIPRFHDTPHRLQQFEDALARDQANRAAAVPDEIAFVRERTPDAGTLLDCIADGRMIERVTHNDAKLDNVLIDANTGDALCVIDLDTVMPGLPLYDFGDCARAATRTGAEDEPDQTRIRCDLTIFEQLVRGYLASAGSVLNRHEIDLLPFAARLITFEIGTRFLTDYLNGDIYYATHRPNQNLDRARVQFAMVRSMEAQASDMEAIVRCYR